MMSHLIHSLFVVVYVIAPPLALARAIFMRMARRQHRPLRQLRLTAVAGMGAGVVICVIYATSLGARLIFTQVLLTGYLATSLMLLLQLFDRTLWFFSRSIFRLHRETGPEWWYGLRALMGLVLRVAVVCCIGLPYVLAAVMTYRPKVATVVDPATLYNWNFSRVEFPATDGTRLVGWWIPAPGGESNQTVLLCPGSNSDKASELFLVKRLVPDGYNVLVFDFRAHGESGGQLCSFGDLERHDVLGAMRWLRKNHPDAAEKVAGLGVSTGAAALLAAAADPSPEGQNIDAIAVYDTFDRLDNEADSLVKDFLPAPMAWMVRHVGLPMAGWQVGANLPAFAPATQINAIWPRPVLVIHGIDDEIVPFEQGQSLYDAAMEPKMNFWIDRCGHTKAIENPAAARFVKKCFDQARRVI
jgi:fermentation-respiration switch protein FrsA (DUF1100 family)